MALDWSQPPMECIEESAPRPPRKTCPNLTRVKNPSSDFPSNMSSSEKKMWTTTYSRDMAVCRAQEILRREKEKPGSFSAATIEFAWMRVDAIRDDLLKRKSVSKASVESQMPQTLLVGALLQESFMANLGIAFDGGNYSCGLGQLNPAEWCTWMESLSLDEQKNAGWPSALIAQWKSTHSNKEFCSNALNLSMMEGFYKRAVKKLNGLPEYRLNKTHFQGISETEIKSEFPAADADTQKARYASLKAFIDNCNSVEFAIRGKAKTIARIFEKNIPQRLKDSQRYINGKTFARDCAYTWKSNYYPAHPGWLMAIAIYNMGPRVVELLRHYEDWNENEFQNSDFWLNATPQDLVDMIYWSGKYNSQSDLIEYTGANGATKTIAWYRQCINQRHISNTISGVTQRGSVLVAAQNKGSCPQSVFDSNGALIQSKVPAARQQSSGRREVD